MDAPTPPDSIAETPAAWPTSRQRRILWTALTALAVTSLLGVSALVFFGFITFLSWSYPILLPIGLAVIIALVLEPVVAFAQKRGPWNAPRATLLVCLPRRDWFPPFLGLSFTAPGRPGGKILQQPAGLDQ